MQRPLFFSIILVVFLGACAGNLEDQITDEEKRAEAVESGLAERVAVLEAAVAAFEASSNTMQTAIDSNTAACTANASDISSLQNTVAGHAVEIGANTSAVTENGVAIDDLEAADVVHTGEIAVNALAIEQNTTRIHTRHDELLFAWDGAGRYLGRVHDYYLATVSVGALVITPSGLKFGVALTPSGSAPGALGGGEFYFTEPGCSGSALLGTDNPLYEDALLPVLVQFSGEVYEPVSAGHTMGQAWQSRGRLGPDNTCTNTSNVSNGHLYTLLHTFAPYTPGVYIAPMPWE